MAPSAISFIAHCPICDRNVSATTRLGRADLMAALAQNVNFDVRALHMANEGDHEWSLTTEQKTNLHKHMADGLV